MNGGEFSIGRGPENDWVLADPTKHLSKRHCVIAFRHGTWQIAGTSTNGTFINHQETPLEAHAPHALADGDRLMLGTYEIEVRLVDEVQPSWGRPGKASTKSSPIGNPFDDDPFASNPSQRPPAPKAIPEAGADQFSYRLPASFDPLLPDEDDPVRGPTRPDHSPAISDAINLPPTRSVLPDDWDLEDLAPQPIVPSQPGPAARVPVAPPSSPAPSHPPASSPPPIVPAQPDQLQPAPAPTPPPAAAPPAGDLVAAFLRGAGVQNLVLPDPVQTMEQLGAAFRALVSGIRRALIARSEVKREFRIEATLIGRRGNNILKFSADDDDALTGLLGAGRRIDMGPEEAITDALSDIRLHELATMTAMQTAVRALVMRLGPDRLRDALDQGSGLALLSNRKARAWDAYEALHAEVLRGLSDDFDSLFGKRFALAYEQAMQELRAKQKNPPADQR